MDTHIDSIETVGPDRRARRLVFADASEPRTTSAAAAKEMGLQPGLAVDRAAFEGALCENERHLAKERALRLLGYRERSVAEIDKRLADDGYPPDARRESLRRLLELGLLDDERFASVYARSRLLAGYGARRIESELKQRGIEPPAARRAILEASADEDELARARRVLRGRSPASRRERDRLLRKLVARGFDFRVALEALDTDPQTDLDGPLVGE